MTHEAILSKITAILREVLDNDSIVLTDSTAAADVPGWDSFNHINFIVATEKYFGIRFRMHEIGALQNVGAFVDAIEKRTQQG